MKSKLYFWDLLIYLMALLLFGLCFYRSFTLSMTHDESSTYFFFRNSSIFPFLRDGSLWTSANNHLLNTFFFQITYKLFGSSEWSLRLPNVLSFLLYAGSTIALGRSLFKKGSLVMLFFVLSCANPYVFDFFSLNRGYGISLAFQMSSFLMAWKYINERSNQNLFLLLASLFLMSFALFSSLLIIPSFLGALFFILILNKELSIKTSIVGLVFMLLCALIFYTPLSALSKLGEFNYGADSLWNSLKDFANRMIYSKQYFGSNTVVYLLLFLGMAFVGLTINQFRKPTGDKLVQYHRFIVLSSLILITGLLMSNLVLGTLYPVERKTLLLLPFAALIIVAFLDTISIKPIMSILVLLLISLGAYHFYFAHQLDRTKEWWYDFDTKNIISILNNEVKDQQVNLAVNWGFFPTSQYYLELFSMDNVKLLPYSKQLRQGDEIDYYICMHDDFKVLKKDFDVHYENISSIKLLKRKRE